MGYDVTFVRNVTDIEAWLNLDVNIFQQRRLHQQIVSQGRQDHKEKSRDWRNCLLLSFAHRSVQICSALRDL